MILRDGLSVGIFRRGFGAAENVSEMCRDDAEDGQGCSVQSQNHAPLLRHLNVLLRFDESHGEITTPFVATQFVDRLVAVGISTADVVGPAKFDHSRQQIESRYCNHQSQRAHLGVPSFAPLTSRDQRRDEAGHGRLPRRGRRQADPQAEGGVNFAGSCSGLRPTEANQRVAHPPDVT